LTTLSLKARLKGKYTIYAEYLTLRSNTGWSCKRVLHTGCLKNHPSTSYFAIALFILSLQAGGEDGNTANMKAFSSVRLAALHKHLTSGLSQPFNPAPVFALTIPDNSLAPTTKASERNIGVF